MSHSPYRGYDIYAGQLARTFTLNVDTLYTGLVRIDRCRLYGRRETDATGAFPMTACRRKVQRAAAGSSGQSIDPVICSPIPLHQTAARKPMILL